MNIEIDPHSGFCYGVVCAIQMAEDELLQNNQLYCLGDIVHNNKEVERLKKRGLITINHDKFKKLKNCKVLIRAHGEPPETYEIAKQNHIELIDASCPVVLKLQDKIKDGFRETVKNSGQIVIYGKKGHAEVNGLVGQTSEKAIVIENISDFKYIDFKKPITIYSQTTKSRKDYNKIKEEIKKLIKENGSKSSLIAYNTICGQVSNRKPRLKKFVTRHDVVIFVSGKKSSNGKVLFDYCKKVNPRTFFISDTKGITLNMINEANSIGICGATSTPSWLMEEIKVFMLNLLD